MDRGRTATGDRNGSRIYPERLKRGSEHPNSKQTPEISADILRFASTNELSYQGIADLIYQKYGVRLNQATVGKTIKGRNSFGNITEPK